MSHPRTVPSAPFSVAGRSGVTLDGAAVRLDGLMDVHFMDRQRSCRCGSMPVCVQRCVMPSGMCCKAVLLKSKQRAVAQLARVPVSKTGGWGFESLLPCQCGRDLRVQAALPADI